MKSIGIGLKIHDRSVSFDCAAWFEGQWKHDEEMEKALDSEPAFTPAPGQKLPGRNALCLCGSGKKFKKCCLPKIEASLKNRPN
ncbi:MAG: SEC-C domain-containing protein [Deltaproteobacteria bacterium]|nr:SEC-C domain-containing protein [Deltaproteobacteria bacterium]